MHHAFLDDVEGLSLERTENGVFQSASTLLMATPGYKNSRFIPNGNESENEEQKGDDNAEENFELLSSVVHIYNSDLPENVILLYRLHKSCKITVKVYSLAGYPVFSILENELLSGEGKLYWDGRGENSEIMPVGMYVIVVEIYSEDGEYSTRKYPVAIVP